MSTHLERLAQRVESDPFFLAAALACYAAAEHLDDDGLAARLGCVRDTLTHLRLCRNPNPEPPHFGRDVERIAARFGLDADRLAEIVRFGQGLLHFRRTPDQQQTRGHLMAARELEPEDPPPGESP